MGSKATDEQNWEVCMGTRLGQLSQPSPKAIPASSFWLLAVCKNGGGNKALETDHHNFRCLVSRPSSFWSLVQWELKVGTRKWEIRNGKWGNGKKVATFHSANCWCFVTVVINCPSLHSLRDPLCPKVGTEGITYATALHHSLQASSMYKFFNFGGLLAFLKLNLWIVPTLHKGVILGLLQAVVCIR